MDISSSSSSLQPESEQQQQQQLQQLYQEQQQQQLQQYGNNNYTYYDQQQPYDYSSSSSYYQQQQQQLPHQQDQHYAYYPQLPHQQDQHHAYYPQLPHHHQVYDYSSSAAAYQQQQQQQPLSLPHQPGGLATQFPEFSQVSQYAGNMERTVPYVPSLIMPHPVHVLDCDDAQRQINVQWIYLKGSGSHYRGGGRRGGASSRGGGRDNFGNKRPSSGGSGQPSGGQGRNKAKGVAKPKVASSTGNIGSNQQPGGGFRCEICDVECNSLEILENHKNGKKHKKILLRIEAENKFPKLSTETQNMEQPTIGPNPKENSQTETTQEAEKGNEDEKASHEAEKEQQQQNSIAGPTGLTVGNGERGVKRKMTTGGKKIKTPNPSRRKIEPARQPKVVIPVVCDLCNVKCDTREVFEKHLAGKKHIGKLKRFEGHQNMYGPMGLQALYPPNPIAQTHFDNGPSHSVYGGSQVSNPPISAYVPPQNYQVVGPAAPGGSDPYNPFNPAIVVTYEPDSQNGTHV